jgi:flagellar motor protein MotB
MATKDCRCKKPEACEECPEWIFTFADLVMLMMGFFVILWVLKPAPGEDGDQQVLPVELLAAIREQFGYLPDPKSDDPVDIHMLMKRLEQLPPMKGPGDGGKTRLPARGAEGTDPEVTTIRKGKQAAVGGRLLFAPGQSVLRPDTRRALDQIASLIRGHRNIFLVKGHASLDDFPDTATAEQKMDLSLRRAQAVADYLTKAGISPDILRVQGCSTFEPVAMRAYTDDVRILNRRVEVEETSTLVEELQGAPGSAALQQPLPIAATPNSTIP